MNHANFRRPVLGALIAFTCLAVAAPDAGAWGLKTHLLIAEKVLADLDRYDCKVDLGLFKPGQPGERQFHSVPRDVCDAIRMHRAEFRAGVLGPDVFPDFVVGQTTTHPGSYQNDAHSAKWSTGRYLKHVLHAAKTPAEIAFAYGYLVHAAGDIFAHTYVNQYAGGVFDLWDNEPDVEWRHMALEKYIEARTPLAWVPDDTTVRVPARFVAETLVLAPQLGEPYGNTSTTKHLVLMRKAHDFPRIEAENGRARMLLEEDLKRVQDRLKTTGGRIDNIKRGLLQASQPTESKLGQAQEQLKSLNSGALKALIDKQVTAVESARASTGIEREPAVSPVLDGLRKELAAIEQSPGIESPLERLTQASATLALAMAQADDRHKAVSKKKLEQAGLILGAFDRLKQAGELVDHASLPDVGAVFALNVATLKGELANLEAEEKSLVAIEKQLQRNAQVIEFDQAMQPTQRRSVQEATDAYLEASMQTALRVMNESPNALDAYQRWRACWALTYARVPDAVLEAACTVSTTMMDVRQDMERRLDALIERLPAPARRLVARYEAVRDKVRRWTEVHLWDQMEEDFKLITDGKSAYMLMKAVSENSEKMKDGAWLKDAYTQQGPNDLLRLPDIQALVIKDLGLSGERGAGLEGFHALRHSIVLSKLALLNFDSVNKMVAEHVGPGPFASYPDGKPLYPGASGFDSILTTMAKSIDGNHQWQAFGMTYPREKKQQAVMEGVEKRRFGYDPTFEAGYGLRLFAVPEVREKLFVKLFPAPVAGAIVDKLDESYPFQTCESVPFPLTTDTAGKPLEFDRRCQPPPGGAK